MTQEEIQNQVNRIEDRLQHFGRQHGVELHVDVEDTKYEDEWLYVCVASPGAGIRVSDYAEILVAIERELRADNIDNVLLVPTLAA